jgi:hypothetical protein
MKHRNRKHTGTIVGTLALISALTIGNAAAQESSDGTSAEFMGSAQSMTETSFNLNGIDILFDDQTDFNTALSLNANLFVEGRLLGDGRIWADEVSDANNSRLGVDEFIISGRVQSQIGSSIWIDGDMIDLGSNDSEVEEGQRVIAVVNTTTGGVIQARDLYVLGDNEDDDFDFDSVFNLTTMLDTATDLNIEGEDDDSDFDLNGNLNSTTDGALDINLEGDDEDSANVGADLSNTTDGALNINLEGDEEDSANVGADLNSTTDGALDINLEDEEEDSNIDADLSNTTDDAIDLSLEGDDEDTDLIFIGRFESMTENTITVSGREFDTDNAEIRGDFVTGALVAVRAQSDDDENGNRNASLVTFADLNNNARFQIFRNGDDETDITVDNATDANLGVDLSGENGDGSANVDANANTDLGVNLSGENGDSNANVGADVNAGVDLGLSGDNDDGNVDAGANVDLGVDLNLSGEDDDNDTDANAGANVDLGIDLNLSGDEDDDDEGLSLDLNLGGGLNLGLGR